ncbi:hypothetical protein ABZP36_003459 [Zizania latifolia]
MDVVKAAQLSGRTLEKVVVHPLVLLSIVDHYNRVARDTRKRVVGVLLGTSSRGSVDVTNSYAVPFEEDDKDPRIWFLDHNYHESMFSMFKRINAKEHVVGWYSTGPKLRENDLDIHALFNKYVPCLNLFLKLCSQLERNFLRSNSSSITLLHVTCQQFLNHIQSSVSEAILLMESMTYSFKKMQDVFNLLPNLNVNELIKAFAGNHTWCHQFTIIELYLSCGLSYMNSLVLLFFPAVKTNDMMLVIYLSSLIRSVIALHNLINNKMLNKEHEKAEDSKPTAIPTAAGS